MDQEEFKADDELKPDASDRRPPRARNRRAASPRLAVSRQHLMIGIGVLVLLVVIVAIGSALKSPAKGNTAPSAAGGPREINLSETVGMTGGSAGSTMTDVQDGSGVSNSALSTQPQPITMPPVSPTPTQSAPALSNNGQQRISLAGNSVSDALTQQQDALDTIPLTGTLPTAPATLASGAARLPPKAVTEPAPRPRAPSRREERAPVRHSEKTVTRAPVVEAPRQTAHLPVVGSNGRQVAHLPQVAGSSAGSPLRNAPGGHYTLQLSGASQPNTLNAFARSQNLGHYWVYETSRNGKPWYVLVSGSYATPAEARRAIAALPTEVQAMRPWARSLSQVQKDAK